MRGPLATATGYRSPPPSRSVTPPTPSPRRSAPPTFPPLGETERGHAPQARRRAGGGERRAKAHRSPPPSPLSRWRPLHNRPRASMGGAGRSCLFSPREKIEMRGTLATATGYRSPPPSRSALRLLQVLAEVHLQPFPLWGKLKEGTRPRRVGGGRGGRPAARQSPSKPAPFPSLPLETLRNPPAGKHGWGREVLPLLPTGED